MHTQLRVRLLAVLFGSLIVLVACGQKGPLYHPDGDHAAQEQAEQSQ